MHPRQDGVHSLRKSTHKRALVRQQTHPAHKCIGAQGCLSGPKVLSKEPIPQGGMPENGQHSGGSPCEQQRRYPFTLPLSTHIGTLAMVPGEEHHDISSAHTWQVEHHSRLGIEGVQRQQRVEDRPSNDFPLSQGVRNRPVCFSPIYSPARQLASGPETVHADAVDNGLGTLQGLRLSTFQSDPSCPKQSVSGQSGHHISGTHLASTTMVATATEPPDRTSSPPAELQTPPEGPSRPSENSSNVPQTTLSCVSCLRGQYQAMGIPDNVTEILLSASRQSTRKTYPFNQLGEDWSSWCVKRKIDPLSAPLTDILLYLTEYFNIGAAYRSVNVARSAISTSHAKLNGLPVGQNPLVIQLLKGMFSNRPPKPRYSHTWEVSLVTTYLASLGSNRSLSLKQLS